MRTRTKGIQLTDAGERIVEKQYRGQRIFARLGKASQDEAESYLRAEYNRIDRELGESITRYFADAAQHYLIDCQRRKVRTVDLIAYHVMLVLPFIGNKPLEAVHSGSLQAFCDSRLDEDKVSAVTVNRTLEVVRSILTKAARVWRDDEGMPWLNSAPLIEMLATAPRKPYPLNWDEQRKLFAELPPHLHRMALFAVNTGARDENVCGLQWDWETRVPELGVSVFVVPAWAYKGNRPHVIICNEVAMRVVEACRGAHEKYVFTYCHEKKRLPPDRVDTMNNTAWQKARKRAGLEQVRVHDLRHTFGQRLRDAGVSQEDRAVLMGHATETMPEHYATPTVANLVKMANLVSMTRDSTTLLRVVNG